MEIKKTLISAGLFALFGINTANAEQIATNMAQMQAMDKITGRVSIIEVPVGGEVKFGTFSVVVRSCKTNSEGEIPENYAFVDVTDKTFDKEEFNIFKGWMMSSSPAVHAVEHPIYDVWLLKCFNSEKEITGLLSEEELAKRDELPRLQEIQQQIMVQEENSFTKEEKANITFKDSMYKEQQVVKKDNLTKKEDGKPQNLLNIDENFEEFEEETVTISADELSKAINEEAVKLIETKNKTEEAIIDEELEDAINAELAKLKRQQ